MTLGNSINVDPQSHTLVYYVDNIKVGIAEYKIKNVYFFSLSFCKKYSKC